MPYSMDIISIFLSLDTIPIENSEKSENKDVEMAEEKTERQRYLIDCLQEVIRVNNTVLSIWGRN